MPYNLTENETRVLGCLIEKQLTTPEYYPLTMNALIAACNQKSNRELVLSLSESEVQSAIDRLRDLNLVYLFYGSTSRTVKYKHMVPSVLELDESQVAAMALLFLRGAQTPGEIRGRAERLHAFSGVMEVQETLDALAGRPEPLIAKLERRPGQKEVRYAHLLSGALPEYVEAEARHAYSASANSTDRISALEQEVEQLKEVCASLKDEFNEFRKQFE
ncbi:MAG: YceH family protein [Blastocatellia bacterium]|nr:YceH family protein [Blastocatellia bacterium]